MNFHIPGPKPLIYSQNSALHSFFKHSLTFSFPSSKSIIFMNSICFSFKHSSSFFFNSIYFGSFSDLVLYVLISSQQSSVTEVFNYASLFYASFNSFMRLVILLLKKFYLSSGSSSFKSTLALSVYFMIKSLIYTTFWIVSSISYIFDYVSIPKLLDDFRLNYILCTA